MQNIVSNYKDIQACIL